MLTNDDWTVLTQYHELLGPLQEATVRLQGHAGGRFGCIWQVLPAFEYLLRHFAEQRQRYPVPVESSQLDHSLLTSESHFSTACNLGWQKLDEYYTKLDESPVDEEDEGVEVDEHDELNQYLVEHSPAELTVDDSPISYWLTKRQRWSRLSSLALDIYAVPAMSGSPERLFSQAGDAISSRRRLLHSETVEWLMSFEELD
ncbi:Hypothetical protein D9617_74g064560 [Elsinoe fawcettii]|nr:Hypothetical protein D9617_74g064560 [Elsinoe fawcettii]